MAPSMLSGLNDQKREEGGEGRSRKREEEKKKDRNRDGNTPMKNWKTQSDVWESSHGVERGQGDTDDME